jgi:diaminopimelate decarboxylase
VIKKISDRTWCLLDGGLADNPRPALYGARYTALPVRSPDRPHEDKLWFAGPHCESGDILIEALPFPRIQEGDLVAVPVSGAYQLSMASNYNGSLRPAVLWLEQGRAFEIQVRETNADLLARDRRLVKP